MTLERLFELSCLLKVQENLFYLKKKLREVLKSNPMQSYYKIKTWNKKKNVSIGSENMPQRYAYTTDKNLKKPIKIGYLGSLEIAYEFCGGFSISAKNIAGILVEIALTLQVALSKLTF